MEIERHKVYNFQKSKIDTNIINEKFEEIFNKRDSATKINIALAFNLQNFELVNIDISMLTKTIFWCDKSHLHCTKANLLTIQEKIEKFVGQCTQERQSTSWRFKLITNVTIFAGVLKHIIMWCPDTVLPEPLLRHTQVNCFYPTKTSNHTKNICVFSAHWPCT